MPNLIVGLGVAVAGIAMMSTNAFGANPAMYMGSCDSLGASLCNQYDWYDNSVPGCSYDSSLGSYPWMYCTAVQWYSVENESINDMGVFCFNSQSDCQKINMSSCPEVASIMQLRQKGQPISTNGVNLQSQTIYGLHGSDIVSCCNSCSAMQYGGTWEDDDVIYNHYYEYTCVAPAGTPMWSCEQTATKKRCTYGYYSTNGKSEVDLNETLNCAKCETDCGMSMPGSDSKTDCWFSAGCSATDTKGTYTFSSNCYWTN